MSAMTSRRGDSSGRSISARLALPRIPTSRLLKSCAMPPASTPRLSSFCACCIFACSASRFAVETLHLGDVLPARDDPEYVASHTHEPGDVPDQQRFGSVTRSDG